MQRSKTNPLSRTARKSPSAKTVMLAAAALALAAVIGMTGCASGSAGSSASPSVGSGAQGEVPAAKELEGSSLSVYCGAGMTDPFQDIADAFTEQTGCTMNVTYANAAQIQTQIQTTEEGDFFIAGSADELKPIEDYVEKSTDLVKHIPVLAVPAANPAGVAGLADLENASMVLVGDPEATPIGKIGKKALTQAGVWDSLEARGALTTTTTAPQIATALANGEGDAGIVWKENVKTGGAEIVDTADLDPFVKTIPAAELTCSKNDDAAQAFSAFLQADAAWDIWAQYGYERA